MPDPVNAPPRTDPHTTPVSPKPRRAKRFVLPDDHHDERTAARIEAFVHGPTARPRRSSDNGIAPEGVDGPTIRPRRPFVLDTRPDWTGALHHEDARHARYGRPVSVLLIELAGDLGGPALDRVAGSLTDIIRAHARETDQAVRLAAGSFRLLMPESGSRSARAAADRLERAFTVIPERQVDGAVLRIEIATPSRVGSLHAAVADAQDKLDGKNGRH